MLWSNIKELTGWMMENKIRVLWLLNHTTLRKFEAKQLNDLGVDEIFMPKSFPYDEGNLSANISFSHDESLTIPRGCLDILNQQDWYGDPSDEAWNIANKYFDVAIIGFFPSQIKSVVRSFKGAIALRVFGLSKGYSYSELLYSELGPQWVDRIKRLGPRFWFGAGYEHLAECEYSFLRNRNCFLPVGLSGEDESHLWEGREKKVLFVCPRIGSSPYFKNIYDNFKRDFSCFEYTVGGAQPILVDDERVIGFVSREQHEFNMRQYRVMYYHSTEPNHIHYHPFEAIRAGMPLVFMAGGMLDLMGGVGLPGRCKTIADAQKKIRRILSGDYKLIERIRQSQSVLLESIKAENCELPWREGFKKILTGLEASRVEVDSFPEKRKRIAVIVPIEYRGGSLRGAKLLAEALYRGSKRCEESAEIVLFHLASQRSYPDEEFSDLPEEIKRRAFKWKVLDADESRRAMHYAGHREWEIEKRDYMVPDDDICQLLDCDVWLVISDRLSKPLLPLRPIVLMVYDYLQRFVPILPHGQDQAYLDAARDAERVLVTTEFSKMCALQYAGVDPANVIKVPMLAPSFNDKCGFVDESDGGYFIWTTNLAPHKNHENAYKALRIYYESLGGGLKCYVSGVETEGALKSQLPHLIPLKELSKKSRLLRKNVKWVGELPDEKYRNTLSAAKFLWHAGKIDNGTFSVIEAATMGVPALSSDYPAMREINAQFSLNLTWMDAADPIEMANQLKYMELNSQKCKKSLPSFSTISEQNVYRLSKDYWEAVRQCL